MVMLKFYKDLLVGFCIDIHAHKYRKRMPQMLVEILYQQHVQSCRQTQEGLMELHLQHTFMELSIKCEIMVNHAYLQYLSGFAKNNNLRII